MKTRWLLVAGVAALQVAVLGFMAGEREWVVRRGQQILLRTAPIDPNDPMRGDYAKFDYEVASVPASRWRGGLKGRFDPKSYDYRQGRDLRVYAALQVNEGGIAELVSLSDERPSGGLYLQGRVAQFAHDRINVRYGIEAMFMQQGRAQKLEDARRLDRPGAPIDAEVAVSGSGLAVLKGYHWEPLGITATFERESEPAPAAETASRPGPRRQFVRAVMVELKNYGPEDVAIVDLPNGGSLRLVPDERIQQEAPRYRWSRDGRTVAKPVAGNVIVLKPGQTHTMRVDLMQPEWFVVDTKARDGGQTPMPLRDVTDAWMAMFRLEYAPPTKTESAGLPNAALIRHGRLLSRAFNPTTSVD